MAPADFGGPMAEGCIFCKIVAGDIEAQVIHRDDHTCAFLDVNPLVKGHTLVVPVRHHARLAELDREAASRHMAAIPVVVKAVTDVTEAHGATVAWNDGPAAGQEVPHLHAHVIPRYDQDTYGPIHTLFTQPPRVSQTEMKQLGDRLRLAVERT